MKSIIVDGRNAVYRAVFASQRDNSDCPVVIFIKILSSWIRKFSPDNLHICWDAKTNNLWRKRLLPEYKDRDTDSSIKQQVDSAQDILFDCLKYLNIYQYKIDNIEADDIIYSLCRLLKPEDCIVISSDDDFKQLLWHFDHVTLYLPSKKVLLRDIDYDHAIAKALIGDKSDNIAGYKGIAEIKGGKLSRNIKTLSKFLNLKGSKDFYRNLALIDLSVNPQAVIVIRSIVETLSEDIILDIDKFKKSLTKNKIFDRRHATNLIVESKKLKQI